MLTFPDNNSLLSKKYFCSVSLKSHFPVKFSVVFAVVQGQSDENNFSFSEDCKTR